MATIQRTGFYDRHLQLGAKMVDFGGWEMPIQYPAGIVQEHLATRKTAGIFDVSHMGRFSIRGPGSLAFLQHVLTNHAAAIDVGWAQYTIIPNENGGAVDDAYLYRFVEDEYLLVVNAANRQKDWDHLTAAITSFDGVELLDHSEKLAMLSLQGPSSKTILERVLQSGTLPEPMRNALSAVTLMGKRVLIARTGYTGEPICFELFADRDAGPSLWDLLIKGGATPVGLGARDTLRLEAGLPLYGHEFGQSPEGQEIPILACPLARFAVSFAPAKGDYVGRNALEKQFRAYRKLNEGHYDAWEDLPHIVRCVALTEKGVARAGNPIFAEDSPAGVVTSGTMVPYWKFQGEGIGSRITEEKGMRAIALALLDSRRREGEAIHIDIRGKRTGAVIVPYHLRSEAPPYARAILCNSVPLIKPSPFQKKNENREAVTALLHQSMDNTRWRQQECINLIPSEQTPSAMVRLLSVLDPVGRYGEHKSIRAFCDAEVFYYQGTDFISEVESRLREQLAEFLGCKQVESRPVSGQLANMAVFSALVDYINRSDRKSEQRRLQKILNHHIIKGGHLSAQPMGALRDFVARDPVTEKPAVINFPVRPENPYQIDVEACADIIEIHRPELIILGKSMIIHKEPVAEMRELVHRSGIDCIIMYDMAHVLGLVGPYFQQPFREGADLITGSTHKTYFGTQRGVIAADYLPEDLRYPLWEAVERRTFPGSVSNHHLGTLLGLLMAAYEMNHFKDPYQQQVLSNAKAFARALDLCGLSVAGDREISFTETHQVILQVGYARGPDMAHRLEENNIIVNYQAAPEEEGFTASGSIRMGVAEMTRFGMKENDFEELAQMLHDVIGLNKKVKEAVSRFRKRFLDMRFCFSGKAYEDLIQSLHRLI